MHGKHVVTRVVLDVDEFTRGRDLGNRQDLQTVLLAAGAYINRLWKLPSPLLLYMASHSLPTSLTLLAVSVM